MVRKTKPKGGSRMRLERANAKINLYLNVLSRREDGYHRIQSVMQTVSLCDLISLDFYPSAHTSIRMQASGDPSLPTDCRNLAFRAAERLLAHTGRSGAVEIRLEKHIPVAAGLAGGSADAAAVLRGLNALLGSPLSTEELLTLGAGLGADVPFCIRGGCAEVGGIGEELAQVPSMVSRPLLVACLGEGVSTPWAYAELDRRYGNFAEAREEDGRLSRLLSALEKGEDIARTGALYNVFEEAVLPQRPGALALRRAMLDGGACAAMMSGSGPSVFGLFSDEQTAAATLEALRGMGAKAFLCYPRAAIC